MFSPRRLRALFLLVVILLNGAMEMAALAMARPCGTVATAESPEAEAAREIQRMAALIALRQPGQCLHPVVDRTTTATSEANGGCCGSCSSGVSICCCDKKATPLPPGVTAALANPPCRPGQNRSGGTGAVTPASLDFRFLPPANPSLHPPGTMVLNWQNPASTASDPPVVVFSPPPERGVL